MSVSGEDEGQGKDNKDATNIEESDNRNLVENRGS